MTNQTDQECITITQTNIIYNTRIFWRQMVYWSSAFFNSIFSGIGNIEETYTRLYNTPPAYAHMLRLILGRSFQARYTSLFSEYIIILRELVMAALSGQAALVNQKVSDLYRNSNERAEFLSEAFPSLSQDVIEEMFNAFHQYEIQEINAYITQDYSKIIEIYDNLITQSETVADYLAKGIIDLITAAPAPGINSNQGPDICITYEELNTILDIAMTWIELIVWFRIYRVSLMEGRPSRDSYMRLNQIPVEFGNRIRGFIDDEIIDAQVLLMQEYIGLMDRLLNARLSNNIEEMNQAYQLAIDNINARAELLTSQFPALDATAWRNQLYKMHSSLLEMATEFLTGNFVTNIVIFDGLIDQAEELGFYFVEGLFDLLTDPAQEV